MRAVRLGDGTTLAASGAIVAVNDPARVAGLLDGPGAAEVAAGAAGTVPVRMAHLDVALRPLPARRFPNVLGLDQPVYLTVQSDAARVTPRDGAIIHVGRYLRPGEEHGDHRPGLERVLDVCQPGWRDHVVDARYVPRSMVCGDHARVDTCGVRGRPGTQVAGVDGLAIVGDWIGPDGMLADAAILSGRARGGCDHERRDGRHQPCPGMSLVDAGTSFEASRPKLMAIAYRLLGSVVEAEDVVGDVAERWAAAERDDIREPEAWLVTVTTRRALDVLRSARLQRESYPGTWLPEPIATGETPSDEVERVETLTMGFMLLLERLTPIERAVLVLHEVLGYSHAETADAVGRTRLPAARR